MIRPTASIGCFRQVNLSSDAIHIPFEYWTMTRQGSHMGWSDIGLSIGQRYNYQ